MISSRAIRFRNIISGFDRSSFICSFPCSRRIMSTSNGPCESLDSDQASLLEYVFEKSMTYWKSADDRSQPVVRFRTPSQLRSVVDFDISKDPVSLETLKKLCDAAFEYGVNTDHPRFYNQLFACSDKYGLAGDLVVNAMNVNAHTYEVAPFFIMTEMATIQKSLKAFGFSEGEGTFCPGGSYSSMLATNVARHWKVPALKTKGSRSCPPLVQFTSKQAHYSALKNAALMGIGTDNCVGVECDERGKMIPSELEKAVLASKKNGDLPFLVIATAGTTVLGAFDPFHEIADICQRHGLWMHTDACWGGPAVLSNTHKHLCNGIEKSNSIAWNPHKLIQMPVQCSIVLFNQKGLLEEANKTTVPYLFQPDKPYDVNYDVSRRLIQCGRRPDGMKLWLAWKANGDSEIERRVDKAMDNAKYLTELVRKREHFRLVIPEPEFTNVSFWFIPPSLRNKEENKEFREKLHLVAPKIKTRMQNDGTVLVGYQPIGNIVNFFRMILINHRVTYADMDFLLDEIEKQGADL